jgi:transcriptional regulator of acetoin/glycerol metabolism
MSTTDDSNGGDDGDGRSQEPPPTALVNAMTGRFDPARLRRAMIRRRWTVDDLAREAGIGRTTAYKTVKGDGVRDRIVIKVLDAIGRCQPCLSVND